LFDGPPFGGVLPDADEVQVAFKDGDLRPPSVVSPLWNRNEVPGDQSSDYVVIDRQNQRITIQSKNGDIVLKAKGTIRIEAESIETRSDKDTTMRAGLNLDAKASRNLTLKAANQGELSASGTLTLKGSTVNTN